MKKIRFYVFGYRDQVFWSAYGPIVRDLMMVSTLCELETVDKIVFYNRPVSLLEVLLGRKRLSLPNVGSRKISFVSSISWDLLGPLKRRSWIRSLYKKKYNASPEFCQDYINVVLDFLPIGDMPGWVAGADLYWYDLIDNFKKHNRYSDSEKNLVATKYDSVERLESNKMISGVSAASVSQFSHARVIPNALLTRLKVEKGQEKFDFGFMGFVTGKFDESVITRLASKGYSIAIFGEFYDRAVEKRVSAIKNVKKFGRFSASESASILATFRVGLIPYHVEMLHDESPLKLYQYIAAGKPVLASFDFGEADQGLLIYDSSTLEQRASEALALASTGNVGLRSNNFLWSERIKVCVEAILGNV